MTESFSHALLADIVRRHLPSGSDLRFEKTATGLFNATYFVRGCSRPVVIRIAPADDTEFVFYEKGMMAQEPGIHRLVRMHTEAPVAEILVYDNSRTLVDRDYLLMEQLPGVPMTHFDATEQQRSSILEQTGRYLRQIHDITADKYGYLGEHHCMEPQDDWASAFRIMWRKMTDDVANAGYYDSSEVEYVNGLLDKHFAHFDRHVTPRLLHMDIWSQNILVDDEANVTGIIDFDRALWGDKELEFAVLDYCGMSEAAFWDGYGIGRDMSESARIRQTFYLLYEIQKYIPIQHFRNTETRSAQSYKTQVMGLLWQL